MPYRIDYTPDSSVLQKNPGNDITRGLMTLTFFILFMFFMRSSQPEIWMRLQAWIWPGDAAVTRNAAKGLWMDLLSGQPVTQSLTVFCREIFRHAGIR